MRSITLLLFIVVKLFWCGESTQSQQKHPEKNGTPSRRHSPRHRIGPDDDIPLSASIPVDYGGNHPYELMAHQRNLAQQQQQHMNTTFNETLLSRNLQTSQSNYRPIKFAFITEYLQRTKKEYPNMTEKIDFIQEELLPTASAMWSEALSVYPTNRIDLDLSFCLEDGGADYDGPTTFLDVDDVAIVTVDGSLCFDGDDGESFSGVLGFAGPCQFDQFFRPVVGFISICTSFLDPKSQSSREKFITVMQHELAHMLGFTSPLFKFFINPLTGFFYLENLATARYQVTECANGRRSREIVPSKDVLKKTVSSVGVVSFELVTPAVRNVVRNQFNCGELMGARLENQPTGNSCFGSHWEQRLFHSEFMASTTHSGEQFLSPLTLAYFEDTGWYKSNYSVTSLSPWGHAAGCDFVNQKCLDNGVVPPHSEGIFCARPTLNGCSATHKFVSQCGLFRYSIDLPREFQYFPSDPNVGGASFQLDFCPILQPMEITITNNKGEEDYIPFDCTNPILPSLGFGNSLEQFGPDSRCFEVDESDINDYDGRAFCLRSVCDEENHVVRLQLAGEWLTCEEDGQILRSGYRLSSGDVLKFKCPRLAQICPDLICPKNCAGRGECDFKQSSNPECKCNNPNDRSEFCANSPVVVTSSSSPPPSSSSPGLVTPQPTIEPTPQPASTPTPQPTFTPTPQPTLAPTIQPSTQPSPNPSMEEEISASPSVKTNIDSSGEKEEEGGGGGSPFLFPRNNAREIGWNSSYIIVFVAALQLFNNF